MAITGATGNPFLKVGLPSTKVGGQQAVQKTAERFGALDAQKPVQNPFSTSSGPNYAGGASLPNFGGFGQAASRLDVTV